MSRCQESRSNTHPLPHPGPQLGLCVVRLTPPDHDTRLQTSGPAHTQNTGNQLMTDPDCLLPAMSGYVTQTTLPASLPPAFTKIIGFLHIACRVLSNQTSIMEIRYKFFTTKRIFVNISFKNIFCH